MEDELERALSRPRYARVAPPSSEETGKPKSVTATAMATGRARFLAHSARRRRSAARPAEHSGRQDAEWKSKACAPTNAARCGGRGDSGHLPRRYNTRRPSRADGAVWRAVARTR